MKEFTFKYVTHEQIPAYLALGWAHDNELAGTHHGFYGELMEWKGEGEPVYPKTPTENANDGNQHRPQHAD